MSITSTQPMVFRIQGRLWIKRSIGYRNTSVMLHGCYLFSYINFFCIQCWTFMSFKTNIWTPWDIAGLISAEELFCSCRNECMQSSDAVWKLFQITVARDFYLIIYNFWNGIRIAWNKFRQWVPLLISKDTSLKVRGILYSGCVRSSMLRGSENWSVRKENEVELQHAEMRMVRWMCGVKLQDRIPSK